MPLTKCPDCRREVSTRAEACPHCGCPLTIKPDVVGGRRVQTVEHTAKRYNLAILIGGVLSAVGIIMALPSCFYETGLVGTIGQWLVVVGLPLYFGARILAWWHHG